MRVSSGVMVTRTCTKCKVEQGTERFSSDRQRSDGVRPWCKSCDASAAARRKANTDPVEWAEATRRRSMKWLLKTKYDMTEEEHAAMLSKQDGCCAICDVPMVKVCVDHDHATGKVRGLLCDPCNNGLGRFQDNITRLVRAISYLGGVPSE